MSISRRTLVFLLIVLVSYVCVLGPFTVYMKQKPVEEKLGYVPSGSMLRYISADHKIFIGAALLMKVIMYYGGIAERPPERVLASPPDFRGMSNIIHTALKLDPYNMDGYYFAQSFLTWEVKQFDIANKLLDYGMKYRTWDWYLPFFAGFNNAYFVKDYKIAAEYYRRAGQLSGEELHINLAGRYMQESGQTELAINYLQTMIVTTRNDMAKRDFLTRLKAFKTVREIEVARNRYLEELGRMPSTVDELVASGYLSTIPSDPYGGQFYLEADGKVATTSKFAFAGAKKAATHKAGDTR